MSGKRVDGSDESAAAAAAEAAEAGGAASDPAPKPALDESVLGSGLLAQQHTPRPEEQVPVLRVCPVCGTEYETGSRFCPADGSPLRPKIVADPLVGTVIAERYHVLKRLGEGGMGRVYLAEHVKMNRQCAVKVMGAALSKDTEAVQRFAREASHAAGILHPNVAAVFDYGESDGLVYLVMEYIEGEPLSTVLKREQVLATSRAVDIARQVAAGLEAAHELGIVHRDLKPDNVMLATTRAGREVAKVVDFGIAKAISDANAEGLTRTGLVIGTPEYMSPEQLLGDPVDARTDVYSLGCMLYQMVTGSLTFAAPTREQLVKRRLGEPPPSVRELVPELPAGLDAVIARALARSPDDRFASAAEFGAALAPEVVLGPAWQADARPMPRSSQTVLMEAFVVTEPIPSGQARTTARRRRTGAAVVATVIALAALTLMLPGDEAPVTPVPAPAAPAPAIDSAAIVARRDSVVRDSVARAESLATAARADSTRRAAASRPTSPTPATTAPTTAAPAGTAATRALRAPIEEYARAIQSGDIERVRAAFPGMTQAQADYLRNNVFALADNIRPRIFYGPSEVKGEEATVDFTLRLDYEYRTSRMPSSTSIPYRATLLRRNGRWLLSALATR